ncbi:GAF domain-containing protein [Amycolatopsis sp. FDAARGOS 1241]|uniref:helix-turn-helix domain-containing protein n=1 Tax=Amycolatopsis sp. FDAARGOS 1241 TaxID=2778070 RepID=UPI001951ADE0|nr:GAF domain-containing protein [Amycolatopsis sp. FDAARGOS 1241]QRP46421.1 GAF domain-containing protein [Amycolatopsis sp. FDAARGOS 1241]
MTAEILRPSTVDTPAEVLAYLTFLLAEEAPETDFDAVETGLRTLPEGDRKTLLRRAVRDARTVRGILARRAQRERETQALYETARDLTSLRDVDDVLSAIVDRVRRLLATDSTYIALIDDDTGDAYMRVTAGTVTEPIRSVRQRPGSGVGGRVIATGRPFATTNYLADPRIHRETQVASAVGEDGVVSIAGVPMKLGSRVIGALFAADRHERTFDQHDIALLTSLAHHASVVIDNARLFGQVGSTTEELREAHAQLSAQRHALELAATAHELLMPLALAGADLGEVADTMARLLDGTVALETGTDRVAATAPGGIPVEAVFRDGTVVPLRAGGETHGRLYFGRAEPLTETELGTLERAAQTATLLVLLERQTATVEQDLRHELVEDLLGEREPDWTALRRRADRFTTLTPGEAHVVVVVSGDTAELAATAECTAIKRGGLASEVDGQVVLLLPGCDAGATARALAADLTATTNTAVTAGAAGPAHDLERLRATHREAVRCHRLLLALGRAGDGMGLDELGVVGVVLEHAGPEQLHRVVRRALGPLLDYDAEHRSALLATVECYFDRGQSPPAAARALGIHVNTLYQRLDRIDRVLNGAGWREPEHTLDLQVALQLYRLMPASPAPARAARTPAPSPSTSSAAHRTPPASAPCGADRHQSGHSNDGNR